VRPTTDYAREAIFSMLESRGGLMDLVVADLYCGSGAMGIEAMSRGAAKVYFVDSDPACLAAARANLEPLQLHGEAVFVRAALPVWAAPSDLDLVLADPPYGPSRRYRERPPYGRATGVVRYQNQAVRHYARNDVGTGQR
jgi:16S rRNA (guanine966-N2)-methyltransferase